VQERVHVAHHALKVLDRDLALAETLPDFDEVVGAARRTLGQWTGLFHEIERTMRRLVGQTQHVIEAQSRIRNVFLGEIDQARVDTKALQRRLQVASELAQVEEQHAFAPLQQRVELAEERRLVTRGQRVGERRDCGTELGLQGIAHAATPRILSIFSLSVIAVNGLMT
jgi:hypothetical protein